MFHVQLPPWVSEYCAMAGLAGVGSLARGKSWTDAGSGRFLRMKFVSELATAIGLGVVVISWGSWARVEPAVLGGICVGAGWLGPEAVSGFLLEKLGMKR